MIRPWPTLDSKPIGDFRVFKLRTVTRQSPRTGKPHDFFVIDSVNWVNVIAVTPNNEIVMVEQYRHGSNTIELEVPGGMLDPEDPTPVIGGQRELREETGYVGSSAEVIGQIFPNPAIQSNTCYTLLVRDCKLEHATEFDHSEDIITHLVPVADLPRLVAAGKIRHCLVVTALYHFDLWQRGLKG